MPAVKRYHQRSFQTFMGTPRGFIIPNAIKSVNYRLLKLGYYGLSLRSMELLGQLAKAGLYNDNLVQHYMAFNGVTQSANAVSSWLNLAPSRISLNKNLVQGTAANMPTWLRHTAAEGNYGYLPGLAANYFSTPDAGPLRITGDIDLRAQVGLTSWTPTAVGSMVAKLVTTGNQRAYDLTIRTTGILRLTLCPDGITSQFTESSAATGFAAGSVNWVRATWRQSDGRVQFFTSQDGQTWTQLGTDQSIVMASIFNSNAPVEVGSIAGGTNELFNGKIYRAQILNGINGTFAFDFNPATYVSGTTFTDSSVNAATITLNGGATVISASALYFDGTNDYLATGPFVLGQPITIYIVVQQVTWTSGDYVIDGITSNGGAVIQTTSTPQLNINAGSSVAANTGLSLKTMGILTVVFNGATSSLQVGQAAATTGNAGVNSMSGLTLGASGGAANFGNVAVNELLVFNQSHSPVQTAIIQNYLAQKYNLGL